nr:MAG TPA: hypothetical protein [Caudoviricetes sp.]
MKNPIVKGKGNVRPFLFLQILFEALYGNGERELRKAT